MKRYSVTLLFQFRFHEDTHKRKKRLCESRTIIVYAKNAFFALKKAKKYGKQEEFTATNDAGQNYSLEFIGITDMLRLGIECGEEEVWYHFKNMIEPMERKDKITLSDDEVLRSQSVQ